MAEEEGQAKEPLNVFDMITVMVEQMAAIAWSKLGLQPDMVTGQIAPDMEQAKAAIDIVAHLSTFIEPRLDENDRREIHNLVRNLRLNYVEKSKE